MESGEFVSNCRVGPSKSVGICSFALVQYSQVTMQELIDSVPRVHLRVKSQAYSDVHTFACQSLPHLEQS